MGRQADIQQAHIVKEKLTGKQTDRTDGEIDRQMEGWVGGRTNE